MTDYKDKFLHIVSFDVPYPADYGGVMDVFHKIRILSNHYKVNIILHCFQYGRPEQKELEKYCHKVYYYPRKRLLNPMKGDLPYIVFSRENHHLLENLLKDTHPILFEGVHTTFYLDKPELKDRLKIVRNHNIEHEYYDNLSKVETNFFKKKFFKKESLRLKKYLPKLKAANNVIAISIPDTNYLKKHGINAQWVSAFHPNDNVKITTSKGKYIFYHGNLGVPENNYAALFLVNEVFKLIDLPVIIAGSNPSSELKKEIQKHPHIELKDKLSNEEIMNHIHEAQINILVTFQATGIKLKLLNSLFTGKHVIVNNYMVEYTGVESLCTIANNPIELAELIFKKWNKPFNESEINKRKELLENKFSNVSNAGIILDLLSNE